jgi:hypothetical protein
MNNIINYTIGMLIACSVLALATNAAMAQDPTKVDAKHYERSSANPAYQLRCAREIRPARAS